MGADLILETKEGNEVMSFRDAYNDFNLLWFVNGSYWEPANDTDKEKLIYLKTKLKEIESYLDRHKEVLKRNHFKMLCDKYNQLREWTNKAEKVLEEGGRIIWSV